ncbi:hypothetical protein TRFO_11220 [Tritrichomonas foetus]|uniref:Uncharacterized protein n=1 Tax=Tritrichomonas foetus TaxID=1144522 RepID=A0A1J4J9M6_9EUKA|nr:hypothetical protein TRFO_11220 [Tritrichomonas foetus]|eukprot:OHS94355.1 hypothetical protein TRFO_11220 [Tritrichomonas foetus]
MLLLPCSYKEHKFGGHELLHQNLEMIGTVKTDHNLNQNGITQQKQKTIQKVISDFNENKNTENCLLYFLGLLKSTKGKLSIEQFESLGILNQIKDMVSISTPQKSLEIALKIIAFLTNRQKNPNFMPIFGTFTFFKQLKMVLIKYNSHPLTFTIIIILKRILNHPKSELSLILDHIFTLHYHEILIQRFMYSNSRSMIILFDVIESILKEMTDFTFECFNVSVCQRFLMLLKEENLKFRKRVINVITKLMMNEKHFQTLVQCHLDQICIEYLHHFTDCLIFALINISVENAGFSDSFLCDDFINLTKSCFENNQHKREILNFYLQMVNQNHTQILIDHNIVDIILPLYEDTEHTSFKDKQIITKIVLSLFAASSNEMISDVLMKNMLQPIYEIVPCFEEPDILMFIEHMSSLIERAKITLQERPDLTELEELLSYLISSDNNLSHKAAFLFELIK